MDISQYIFSPWQRQAELQNTQAATAMRQMEMAAYPEQQQRAAELQRAQIEHYKAQSEEQRALAMKNQMAALQSVNDELVAKGLPPITMGQMASGQIPQAKIPQQMQGAPTTPQQLVGGIGAGQAPVINAQGQYTSQPAMDAINKNMELSVDRLNNLTKAGRVSGPLYEKTLTDVQNAGKAASEIAKNDASRLKSVTDAAKGKLDYVTQLAQVVKTPQDFEMAKRLAEQSGVQWPLPQTHAEAKSFIDRLAKDSKQAVDIASTRQLEAERREAAAKERTEQQIKKVELDRKRAIDAEAKRQTDALGKEGVVLSEQVEAEAKARGTQAGGGGGAGRMESQVGRIVNAANELSRSMETVQDMPMETSGVFGGVKPTGTMTGGIKELVSGKLTTGAQQEYNTAMSGVPRFLAALETYGAATGLVGLTQQMTAIINKPADTPFAQMRKAAEIRQIYDGAIEQIMESKKTPEETKNVLRRSTERIHTAIPFTNKDLNELKRQETKNPSKTMNQLFEERKNKAAQPAALPPQDQLVKDKQYTLPNGTKAIWTGKGFLPVAQ